MAITSSCEAKWKQPGAMCVFALNFLPACLNPQGGRLDMKVCGGDSSLLHLHSQV